MSWRGSGEVQGVLERVRDVKKRFRVFWGGSGCSGQVQVLRTAPELLPAGHRGGSCGSVEELEMFPKEKSPRAADLHRSPVLPRAGSLALPQPRLEPLLQ